MRRGGRPDPRRGVRFALLAAALALPGAWRGLASAGALAATDTDRAAVSRADPPPARFWRLDALGRAVGVDAQLAPDVRDPLFALFAGLIDAGAYGRLEPAVVDSIVTAAGGSRVPYRRIRSITREPLDGGGRSRVRLTFGRDVRLPVPYSVLGYHPGSLVASREVVLEECAVGRQTFRVPGEGGMQDVTVDDVHLFGVREGKLQADVDAVLDWLMGDKADDVDITGLLLLRRDGRRFGVAFGYAPNGQGRSGVFDLSGDQLLFPVPRAYLVVGRTMRERWEHSIRDGLFPCGEWAAP